MKKWVVSQRVGCENPHDMNASFMKRYKLIPVGGVAARLSEHPSKGRAYCFLPLPIDTGLPIHIHGYFALDHESRRHLWEDEHCDELSTWNNAILEHIVAPSYASLLTWLKRFFIDKHGMSDPIPERKMEDMRILFRKYHAYFPHTGNNPYWKHLVESVYRLVVKHATEIFPLFSTDHSDFYIKWKSPVNIKDQAKHGYFNTLDKQLPGVRHSQYSIGKGITLVEHKRLSKILLKVGFPLLESPEWILRKMRQACGQIERPDSVNVLEVSPSNVTSFLREPNPLKEDLPARISKTRIGDVESLASVIDYCKKAETFDNLDRLPLLLTQDEVLRQFSVNEESRVFVSEFYKLFEACSQEFLHRRFLYSFPTARDNGPFRKLDVSAIARLLERCTPFLITYSEEYIPFDRRLQLEWFEQLWDLLGSIVAEAKNKELRSRREHDIHNIRLILTNFAVLPIVPMNYRNTQLTALSEILQLAPISLAETVIYQPRSRPILEALQTLNVYKCYLDQDNCKHWDAKQSMSNFAANVDNPKHVLCVLLHVVRVDENSFKELTRSQHEHILLHFSTCDDSSVIEGLKNIPCFESIGGDFVKLVNCRSVFVLPSKIPKQEQDIWLNKTNALFLQANPSLTNIYKKLKLCDTTELEVYAIFILPAFDSFSGEAKIAHLLRVQEILRTEIDRGEAIEKLKLHNIHLIEDASGTLRKASYFFDPEKELFSVLLTTDDFPPDYIQTKLGLEFLRGMGLQTESHKRFVP